MKEKIRWRIRAGGPLSKPPLLRALRFPAVPFPASGAEQFLVYGTEDIFANFPVTGEHYAFDTPVSSWMELYFETAPGASVDPLSLMALFKVTATNGAFDFSPRFVTDSEWTVADPAAAYGHLYRVEIRGAATNRPHTGMITVEVGAGLRDSLGNKSAGAERFLLLK
jgi:hypothetical protein